MSEQKYPWMLSIYKGEDRVLIAPNITHVAGFSVFSKHFFVVNECCDFIRIGKAIVKSKDIIADSPLSELKPSERIGPWEMDSKYKSRTSFWKNNNCAFFNIYENGDMEVYSTEKIKGGGYGGCIKEIKIPKNASEADIGRAVIEVFQAAEEFYKMNKK